MKEPVMPRNILPVNNRLPDYSEGRFFLSPLLGCPARCLFCYIYEHGYTTKPVFNELTVEELSKWLVAHPKFVKGKAGSLIYIGAWGDPFPPSADPTNTLDWLRIATSFDNPVQIISRFRISQEIIDAIAGMCRYDNQIIFSTSISSFSRWQEIDLFAHSPSDRLQTVQAFLGTPVGTNVMIKPFLPGLTDPDIEQFIEQFERHGIQICTVGVFYWTDDIIRVMNTRNMISPEMQSVIDSGFSHSLVCKPNSNYSTYSGNLLENFCDRLRRNNLMVFKNSACVTAHLLGTAHVSKLRHEDPLSLCVKCGNQACEDSTISSDTILNVN
jgi:DNA repair photolyase